MRLSKMIGKVRELINPPYSPKDLLIIGLTLLLLLAVPLTVFSINQIRDQRSKASTGTKPTESPQYVADTILLKFKPGASEDYINKVLKAPNLKVSAEIPQIGVKIIKVAPAARDKLITVLSKNRAVDFVQKDLVVKKAFSPNDPYFTGGYQWNLNKIQAPQTWDITKGNSSFPVAILDTGIDLSHSDLQGKVVASANFSDSSTVTDIDGHGTHVGGIVGAVTNNSQGVASLGISVPLMNGKVLGDTGTGGSSWIAQGVIWATDNGAKVINISAGAPFTMPVLESAINYAWSKSVVVTAAAGNFGSSALFYPAAYSNVIAVASTDVVDHLVSSSNYGDWVDVAAPGGNIYSTLPVDNFLQPGGYGLMGGTSQASPHVAGLAALVFTKVADANGNGFLNDEVRSCIEKNADNIGISGIGGGRINAYKAVQCSSSGTPDTTPPSVAISSPSSGATVSGGITISVTASDNTGGTGVTKVEMYIDGVLFATDTLSPYSFFWDTTNTSNGTHTLTAKAFDGAGNTATSTSVSVNDSNQTLDTTPPSTLLTSPTNGATISGTITISASATDNVGVSTVYFLIDGSFIGSDSTSPYSLSWDTRTVPNGSHTIQTRAVDASNNVGLSTLITVNVNNVSDNIPPTVSITSPLNGSTVARNSTVTISASATDNLGISRVNFYVNGSLKCSDATAGYTCSWKVSGKPRSSYTITAKAYDSAGNVGTSTAVLITSN